MADFKRITFEGATVDYDDVEEIIRFTIEGWYDKNKPKPPQNLIKYADLSVAGCSPDKDDAVARKEALLEAPGRNDTSGTSR
jgi:hypothetical protein